MSCEATTEVSQDGEIAELNETVFEIPFVGRDICFEILQRKWSENKIVEIFGLKGIGKSRLLKEFINRKRSSVSTLTQSLEHKDSADYIFIELRNVTRENDLCSAVCRSLGCSYTNTIKNLSTTWDSLMCETISTESEVQHVLVFDNAEDVIDSHLRHKFITFIESLSQLLNVKVFITSTTKVVFPKQDSFLSYELKPLLDQEAAALLDSVSPNVEFGEHKKTIITLCEGLPLVILMVGSELTEDRGLICPQDMVQLLSVCRLKALSRDFYPPEDRIADVYRSFIERLTATFRTRLNILNYIPGSFDVREAKDMLGPNTIPQGQGITNALDLMEHCLVIELTTVEWQENSPFILQFLLPDVRKRYCKLFSLVLEGLCKKFHSIEYTKAVSLFSVELPNLQKLFTEVYNSKEDTYQYFMQVAATCTEVIDKFLSNESEKFYSGCLAVATSYGKTKDIATVYVALGSMYTNAKGDYSAGEENYRKALKYIDKDEQTLLKATVYQRLGWNLYKRGRYEKSYQCLAKAFEIETCLNCYDTVVSRQTLNSLGLVCTDLGKFSEAKMFLSESLRCCQAIGKRHWSIGAVYDNFGTLYEVMGWDAKAMQYYQKALDFKLSTTATALSIVISLTNIANIHVKLKQTSKALEFSDRAMSKVKEQKIPNREALSLAYNTYGKAYLHNGEYLKASDMLANAVEIRADNSPGSECHIESLILSAQTESKLRHFPSAVTVYSQALEFKYKFHQNYASKFHMAECLTGVCEIYKLTEDAAMLTNALQELQSELIRLERVYMCSSDERRKREIERKLKSVKQNFSILEAKRDNLVPLHLTSHNI